GTGRQELFYLGGVARDVEGQRGDRGESGHHAQLFSNGPVRGANGNEKQQRQKADNWSHIKFGFPVVRHDDRCVNPPSVAPPASAIRSTTMRTPSTETTRMWLPLSIKSP